MRTRINSKSYDKGSYDISISVLMAALCCIFLLFLIVTIYSYNQKKNELNEKVEQFAQYAYKQEELKIALENEFKDDLDELSAEILLIDGAVRVCFSDNSDSFRNNTALLNTEVEQKITDFFSRMIDIISCEKFKNNIQEIRIEVNTLVNSNDEDEYIKGLELSIDRSKNILINCLEKSKFIDKQMGTLDFFQWINERIVAVGYSKSKISYPIEFVIPLKLNIKETNKNEFIIQQGGNND